MLNKISLKKKPYIKELKAELNAELTFMKKVFSMLSTSLRNKGDDDYSDILRNGNKTNEDRELTKRATSIAELEEKLQKVKSQHNFNIKNKLAKKSLTSKLNKKIKKKERVNKTKIKSIKNHIESHKSEEKPNVNVSKPVYNSEEKMVFSKFDFGNIGPKEKNKAEKDPKKILQSLKHQEEKIKQIEETQGESKAREIREKMAWKNVLQKAEGQKIKDDPILLKKSIKKIEQKKKQSKKQWDTRVQNVEQKMERKQKKRKENISKMKKEKKSKVIKSAIKRGRVVI